DWHWVFLVNLPIGIAVYLGCRALVQQAPGKAEGRLDFAGAATVTASSTLAVYAIVYGNLPLLALAGVLLAIFLGIEAKVAAPLVALREDRQPERRQRGGRALGGVDVRLVLHPGALHPALARLSADADRPRLPAVEPDHGRVLARPLGEDRDALRQPPAARR